MAAGPPAWAFIGLDGGTEARSSGVATGVALAEVLGAGSSMRGLDLRG